MNGISAVVLATGNDTRAVEAGCHSHAVNADGIYSSLSHFEKNADGNIVGTLELPMPVGLVGGATKVHPPVAQAAIKMLGVESAEELAGIILQSAWRRTWLRSAFWPVRVSSADTWGCTPATSLPPPERRRARSTPWWHA